MSNGRSRRIAIKPAQSEVLLTKKETLLSGIAKLFYEQGYEKTSIRDIARSLGLPNSAFYYYFKTKQDKNHKEERTHIFHICKKHNY